MNEKTINFTLSTSTDNDVKKYARYSNLQRPSCIRFFISEQIILFKLQNKTFLEQWNTRRSQKLDVEDGEHYKKFSFKIPDNMYQDLMDMKEHLNVSLNELIVNLVRNELDNIFAEYDKSFATLLKDISAENYRSNISLSNVIKQDLVNISEEMGISLNTLITHILIKYLREHYTDFFNETYMSASGKIYHGLW